MAPSSFSTLMHTVFFSPGVDELLPRDLIPLRESLDACHMNGTQQRPPSRHTPRGCWVMRRARVPEIANPPSLFNPPLQVNFLLLSRILKNKTHTYTGGSYPPVSPLLFVIE